MARDGSLGQTPGALSGPHYTIDVQNVAEQIRGNNLFHSFTDFNVNTGQTASFTGPNIIANIINRVTGQNLSNIDGALNSRTAMPQANLFLMNPNGLVVGPNASFNIGGSIHLSTADYVRMGDGAQFFANLAKQSTLSSAPVTAFGFLGERATEPITVQAGSPLSVREGKGVSLVGGDVSISGRTIHAPGGQINVGSITGVGEQNISGAPAGLAGPGLESVNVSRQGTVHLTSGAMLQTTSSTGPAGSIIIKGGKLIMEHAALESNSGGATPPSVASVMADHGHISIQADDVALSNGTSVTAYTAGGARAGDITMEVRTLHSNVDIDGIPVSGAAPVTIASSSTGAGGAGTISIGGPAGSAADLVTLSNTEIVASVTNAAIPTIAPAIIGEHVETAWPQYLSPTPPATIEMTAKHVTLANGTVIRADTTGGADAGAITLSVDTLKTRAGPDGRVLLSSDSNCGVGCLGGQAGDITIQGIQDAAHASEKEYAFIVKPELRDTEKFVFYLAESMDLQGTDIHSKALGNAAGGKVLTRTQGPTSLTDTNISVETQDYEIKGVKPNGEPARNQGFSRIDMIASDIVMKDSSVRADARVSDIGSCPLCRDGPSAGEIWMRVQNSMTADNSSITNTSRGRAQAGITKIIKEHYFSYGALWDTAYPDVPTGTVRLTNSEVTVEAQHHGLPGYLRIRAGDLILDHSIINSKVNNVSNFHDSKGQVIDVVGAGEAGTVVTDGRSVQGNLFLSANRMDITGGGITAPTQGDRIGNRIDLHTNELTTRQGTRPGGTLAEPRVLDAADPTRVVISSSSTGSGGAGEITVTGESVPIPDGTPFPPASSIRLTGTDVLTDTRTIGRGGKIELRASGPIELDNASVFARSGSSDGGTVKLLSSGPVEMNASRLATSSTEGQGGSITVKGSNIDLNNGSAVTAESHGAKNAGTIELISENNISLTGSSISTEALKASGGDIKLTAPNSVMLSGSTLTASVAGGNETTGGKIDIDPQYVIIQNSQILAKAADGNGGRIAIEASQAVLIDPSSRLDATSSQGISGQVLIQSPIQQLSGAIAPLPQAFAVAANLYGQRCAAQKGGQFSSFVQGARDGVPPQPGDLIASPLVLEAEGATPFAGFQPPPDLPAVRLGLPQLEQISWVKFTSSAGCRS
ncbi:MAG TPA: filamentous hemagglutinin N-terminal domain-containing protein [Nitrospiraceae bacterium]|nr:filamentous hemagglutinin N-terminal domain-containing protein [Nitrospiraceae bacterium]